MIISLLGHLAFSEEKLISMIQKNSKKPNENLNAYNLCNGNLTISEIAKKSGVAVQSLREAIVKWEKLGIIMNADPNIAGMVQKPLHLYQVNIEK